MVAPTHNDIGNQMRQGTRNIEQAYREAGERLGGKGGERVLRKALRGVFADMINQAKSLTPRRRGRLFRRVDVRPSNRRRRRHDFFAIEFGFFRPRPYHKALAVEFGNINVREHGPLRRSWDARQEEVVSDTAAALSAELGRVSTELASKLNSQRRT